MTVLLYPGAGSDSSHASLIQIEQSIAPHPCVRADFPYRKEGRRAPDRAPKLLAAIRDELQGLSTDEPLVMGGRSMGGRMCSMIAAGVDELPPPPNLKGLVLSAIRSTHQASPTGYGSSTFRRSLCRRCSSRVPGTRSRRPTSCVNGPPRCPRKPRSHICSSRARGTI